MVSRYIEFQFYTNFGRAARRDADIGKDYQWYRRNPEEFLTHVCVTYAFANCQP